MDELKRMPIYDLQNLKGLVIENENGKIEFLEPVDVTGFNFDEWLIIRHKNIEMYPDSVLSYEERPQPGEKLNKPALVTLYNFEISKKSMEKKVMIQLLKKRCESTDCEFVSFDDESKEFKFKINKV